MSEIGSCPVKKIRMAKQVTEMCEYEFLVYQINILGNPIILTQARKGHGDHHGKSEP
jgi:hypothetical protein